MDLGVLSLLAPGGDLLVPVAAIGVLSFLGLLAGLLGLRFSASPGLAKIGTLLNGVVLACILLVVLGMAAIFYLR